MMMHDKLFDTNVLVDIWCAPFVYLKCVNHLQSITLIIYYPPGATHHLLPAYSDRTYIPY